MHANYGLALPLGVLIGGAIRLNDVITPEHRGPQPHMAMVVHQGVDSLDPSALNAQR